jgi:hypothetical protein
MSTYHALLQLAGPIGRDIAASDSKTQAALFNGFAEMFHTTMARDLDREMQMAYIVVELTPAAGALIKHLASMVDANAEGKR